MRLISNQSVFRRSFLLLALPGLIAVLSSCASSSSAPTPTLPAQKSQGQPTLASPRPGAYAALGASETFGVGAVPHTDGYAYQVARTLHTTRFVDVGIPGTTLGQGYDTELANALVIRPSLCTVFFGVNDLRAGVTRQAFLQNLYDLVATLRRSRAQVLIIGLPDVSKLPAARSMHLRGVQGVESSWDLGMERVARQTGTHFLDLRQYDAELATHPNYVAADGLHPSNRGHTRLAQVVLAAIQQARLWRNR